LHCLANQVAPGKYSQVYPRDSLCPSGEEANPQLVSARIFAFSLVGENLCHFADGTDIPACSLCGFWLYRSELSATGANGKAHMAATQHLGAICKGAAAGFLFGLASIATVDKFTLQVSRILNKPVELMIWLAQNLLGLSDGSTALMGWLCLGVYWMLLGGLIGWGVSVVHSKVKG
jgi:hypothetical protein